MLANIATYQNSIHKLKRQVVIFALWRIALLRGRLHHLRPKKPLCVIYCDLRGILCTRYIESSYGIEPSSIPLMRIDVEIYRNLLVLTYRKLRDFIRSKYVKDHFLRKTFCRFNNVGLRFPLSARRCSAPHRQNRNNFTLYVHSRNLWWPRTESNRNAHTLVSPWPFASCNIPIPQEAALTLQNSKYEPLVLLANTLSRAFTGGLGRQFH